MATREDRKEGLHSDGEPHDGGPEEAARFVSETVGELAQLARRHGHETLGFLLEMAQLEADEIGRRNALTNL
jgi:hypothetical protein